MKHHWCKEPNLSKPTHIIKDKQTPLIHQYEITPELDLHQNKNIYLAWIQTKITVQLIGVRQNLCVYFK